MESAWSATSSEAPVADIFAAATVIYSVRKFFNWSNAVMKVTRSSDSAEAFLFFDGASANDEISMTSYISTTSETVPDTTTLSTWGSTDSIDVVEWIGQTPNDTINAAYKSIGTIGGEPRIATSGALLTVGSKPCVDSLTNRTMAVASGISVLDVNNAFTILTVSNNDIAAANGVIINTSDLVNDRVSIFNDSRTNKQALLIQNSGATNYFASLSAQQNSTSQKLITGTVDGSKLMTAWFNGTSQLTDTYTGTYTNDELRMFDGQSGTNFLNGTIQEIIIFPTDKTADLTALHADINAYYTIY